MNFFYFSRVLSGCLTPIIAIIAVYIAYQQFNVNRRKLKFELYERRYKMYLFIKEFLDHYNRDYIYKIEEFRKFNIQTNECKFLFDKDINSLIHEIQQNVIKLMTIGDRLSTSNFSLEDSPIKKEVESEQVKLKQWFHDLYFDIESHFMDYLKFKQIK